MSLEYSPTRQKKRIGVGARGLLDPPGQHLRLKGIVANQSELPVDGNQAGDAYLTTDGHVWRWDGSAWVDLGPPQRALGVRAYTTPREIVLRDPLPSLLRIRETAQYLRCSTRHVMKLAAEGQLELIEFGERFKRITGSSVNALVKKRRVQTTTAAS